MGLLHLIGDGDHIGACASNCHLRLEAFYFIKLAGISATGIYGLFINNSLLYGI